MDNIIMSVPPSTPSTPSLTAQAKEAFAACVTREDVQAWAALYWRVVGYKALGEIVSQRLEAVEAQKAKKAAERAASAN